MTLPEYLGWISKNLHNYLACLSFPFPPINPNRVVPFLWPFSYRAPCKFACSVNMPWEYLSLFWISRSPWPILPLPSICLVESCHVWSQIPKISHKYSCTIVAAWREMYFLLVTTFPKTIYIQGVRAMGTSMMLNFVTIFLPPTPYINFFCIQCTTKTTLQLYKNYLPPFVCSSKGETLMVWSKEKVMKSIKTLRFQKSIWNKDDL